RRTTDDGRMNGGWMADGWRMADGGWRMDGCVGMWVCGYVGRYWGTWVDRWVDRWLSIHKYIHTLPRT
ncbi:hypothetical protein BKA81DRAFT_364852, partial [Phyllosticta paracitricarpa]